jgi:4-hydroxybutyrate CoA-transferase
METSGDVHTGSSDSGAVNSGSDWRERYADRLITPEKAASLVNDGDLVMSGLPEATAFLEALGEASHLTSFDVFVPAPRHGGVAVTQNPGARLLTSFRTQILRNSGVSAEVLPVRLNDWGGFIRRVKPRVAVFQVATPDPDGTVRPGSTMSANDAFVRRESRGPNDLVFGLVNPLVPHVPGDAFHVDDFDALIVLPENADAMPVYDERTPPADLDAFIGALDELIPDGATLQAGVGGIAEAAMAKLTHKKNLGVHTEVIGAGLVELIKSGAANGSQKTIYPSEAVFTISVPETFDFIDGNPQMRIESASLVLDPNLVAQNRMMRCINSSIEVDLWAQANSEMIDGQQHSGVGGQLDFLRACTLSNDAMSILVLPSTAAGGTRSRIVPQINQNAVTATRYDTQVIVTEFGIAHLRDATVAQKTEQLIKIAHPDYRAELTEAAGRMGIL